MICGNWGQIIFEEKDFTFEVCFMMMVGYILLLAPTNMLLLKGRRLGVIIYVVALLLDILVGVIVLICRGIFYVCDYDSSNIVPLILVIFFFYFMVFVKFRIIFLLCLFYRVKRIVLDNHLK